MLLAAFTYLLIQTRWGTQQKQPKAQKQQISYGVIPPTKTNQQSKTSNQPATPKVMSRDALHKLRWCELASKVFGGIVKVSTKISSYTHLLDQNKLIYLNTIYSYTHQKCTHCAEHL